MGSSGGGAAASGAFTIIILVTLERDTGRQTEREREGRARGLASARS